MKGVQIVHYLVRPLRLTGNRILPYSHSDPEPIHFRKDRIRIPPSILFTHDVDIFLIYQGWWVYLILILLLPDPYLLKNRIRIRNTKPSILSTHEVDVDIFLIYQGRWLAGFIYSPKLLSVKEIDGC